MNLKNEKMTRVMLGLSIALSFATMSCTRYPTEDELNVLEQQKQAADEAESKVADLENEKARLTRELESAKKDLADHEAEFEEIKKRKASK